jgi:ribonuclease P/MRP protein subunit POP5
LTLPHVGTIRHAQLAAIEHNRVVIARYRALAKTPGMFHSLYSIPLNVPLKIQVAGYQDSYDSFLEKSTLEIQALQD